MSVASAPLPISADGSSLLAHIDPDEREARNAASALFVPSQADMADPIALRASFRSFFDIAGSADFLVRHGCARVGLQFPDELITHATQVEKELKEEVKAIQQAQSTASPCSTPGAVAPTPVGSTPGPVFFILGDTSYGSCCVDEVAAQHSNCDIIIHYGFSCLSSTRRVPVRYVFGRKSLDVDTMIARVFEPSLWSPTAESDDSGSLWGSSPSSAAAAATVDPAELPPVPVVFMYNLEYAHLVSDGILESRLREFMQAQGGRRFVAAVARVKVETGKGDATNDKRTCVGACNTSSSAACACANQSPASSSACQCAAAATAPPTLAAAEATPAIPTQVSESTFPPILISNSPSLVTDTALVSFNETGYSFSLPQSLVASKSELANVHIIWIGDAPDRNKLLTNAMLVYNTLPIHLYHPSTGRFQWDVKSASKTLARRYYLMEKAKNASIVGILVGTLGVSDYIDVIRTLKSALLNAGKKSYTFVVGKLNEPKLSNFGEIEIFVLVACPLNTMFDSTGYYCDVVTPFELIAAVEGRDWTGEYRTDFKSVITNKQQQQHTHATIESVSDDIEHGMRFDPITGKMRAALPSQLHAHGIRLEPSEGDEDHGDGEEGQLVTINDQQLIRVAGGALVHLSTASDYFLAHRTFTGLVLRHPGEGENDVATIQPGLDGIARKYKQTALEPPTVQTNLNAKDDAQSAPAAVAVDP